jgi:hypothetical protein
MHTSLVERVLLASLSILLSAWALSKAIQLIRSVAWPAATMSAIVAAIWLVATVYRRRRSGW